MASLSFTWFGHATFLLRTPGGRKVLLDPWIATNPSCPDSAKKVGPVYLMLITHGHFDHTADAVSVGRESGAQVVASFELATWLQQKGLKNVTGMNLGGTLQTQGLSITMVPAMHSSSV